MIVCDQDAWFGHIEFQNNLGGPQNYTGGNPLPGSGTCDLLDLVLKTKGLEKDLTCRKLLPTASGFFFGSTGYDEWYWKVL